MATPVMLPPSRALWRRWLVAAGVLLALGGAVNVVAGLALAVGDVYVADAIPLADVFLLMDALPIAEQLSAGDAGGWWWFLILVGAAELAAGVGVLRKRFLGVLGGGVFASLHLLGSLALLPSDLLLTVAVIVVDLFLLWALVAHGGRYP
jgi:hypothetical protein